MNSWTVPVQWLTREEFLYRYPKTMTEETQMPWKPTFASLMAANHSVRRLLYEYWHGNLSPEAEAIVESEVPPNILLAHKPSDYH